MATVNNILGQRDDIKHKYGNIFDWPFSTNQISTITKIKTLFDLTGYTALFTIKNKPGGTVLYSKTQADPELTISSSTFRIKDNFTLLPGEYYFELVISNIAEAEKIYTVWFGKLTIEL